MKRWRSGRIRPFEEVIFGAQVRDYRARTKVALAMQGVIENFHVRPPLLPLSRRGGEGQTGPQEDRDTSRAQHPSQSPLIYAVRDPFNVSYIGLPVIKLATENGLKGWRVQLEHGRRGRIPKRDARPIHIETHRRQDALMRKKLLTELSNVENFGWDFRLGRNGLVNMALSAVETAIWDFV